MAIRRNRLILHKALEVTHLLHKDSIHMQHNLATANLLSINRLKAMRANIPLNSHMGNRLRNPREATGIRPWQEVMGRLHQFKQGTANLLRISQTMGNRLHRKPVMDNHRLRMVGMDNRRRYGSLLLY